MKKSNVINLIKYHVERNESAFREESIRVAEYFDRIGDDQLAEYILALIAESNLYVPQDTNYEGEFIKKINVKEHSPLLLPESISNDIMGVINAINHNIGINKFLFEGRPGTGKTEAVKHVSRILNKELYYVEFDNLIDSKLGQTTKNITSVFKEINSLPNAKNSVVLFDEIDVIALDRVNSNDVREMGRVTSTMLRELDRLTDLNKEIVVIATTNLFDDFDKALTRRFDATINFDRYSHQDLVEISYFYFSEYIKLFKKISKNSRLFKKIILTTDSLPYPGELKNVIKTSLAFSDTDNSYDYLRRLYSNLIKDINMVSLEELKSQGFTVREIEILTGVSKSSVSRELKEES